MLVTLLLRLLPLLPLLLDDDDHALQWQRSLSGTPLSALSMWAPQPAQVGLPQVLHAVLKHMLWVVVVVVVVVPLG